MPKKGKVQCFDMKHYVTQKLAAEKAAEVKNAAATVASSSNHLQVGKGKEMNEYDIQKLHGLKYMLSRKKAGATLQEKQRRQEDVQIAKELAALQKQISKDEKSKSSELNEAQLAFLANKQAEGQLPLRFSYKNFALSLHFCALLTVRCAFLTVRCAFPTFFALFLRCAFLTVRFFLQLRD